MELGETNLSGLVPNPSQRSAEYGVSILPLEGGAGKNLMCFSWWTEILAAGSSLGTNSKEEQGSTCGGYQCGNSGHWANNCPSLHLLPGLGPHCGQAELWGLAGPLCLAEVGQSPMLLLHWNIFLVWAWRLETHATLRPLSSTNPSISASRSPGSLSRYCVSLSHFK